MQYPNRENYPWRISHRSWLDDSQKFREVVHIDFMEGRFGLQTFSFIIDDMIRRNGVAVATTAYLNTIGRICIKQEFQWQKKQEIVRTAEGAIVSPLANFDFLPIDPTAPNIRAILEEYPRWSDSGLMLIPAATGNAEGAMGLWYLVDNFFLPPLDSELPALS